MLLKRMMSHALAALFILTAALTCAAQTAARPAPEPSPQAGHDEQDQLKVYVEEVFLPVVAYDEGGRFDPTLEPDDILVLEDNVPQQIKSVRRLPASILLVLDIGSQITGLTGSSNTTREVALKLADTFAGDEFAIVQNSKRVELLLDWTTDPEAVAHVLKTKFFTGARSRLSECLLAASEMLRERPAINAHLIILTDGLESGSTRFAEAVRSLAGAQATVHIIAYSAIDRRMVKSRNRNFLDLDYEMKRWFKNYADEMKRNEERLAGLAEATGGRLFLPASTEEAIKQVGQVGQDIRSQYVVTYSPKRPFASSDGAAAATARRAIRILPRRSGLRLISLRNSVSAPAGR